MSKIELNTENIKNQLLKSDWIAGECKSVAETVASKAGCYCEIDVYIGQNRINVSVSTDDPEAIESNALLRGI